MDVRSRSQSIIGSGFVATVSAGSSAPYSRTSDARMVIARTPASLFTVHLPLLSNQDPPHWRRIGLNWIMVQTGECIANLAPCRMNLLRSLTVSRLATSPNSTQVCGASLSGSRPASVKCLVLIQLEKAWNQVGKPYTLPSLTTLLSAAVGWSSMKALVEA